MVMWIEKPDGTFVDTIFITAKTGLYGLGNRPGIQAFNSGPYPDESKGIDDMWPYGRREGTFPIWAHRHGMSWPAVIFQDNAENNLSHSVGQSSLEATPPYCRPMSSDGNSQCWLSGDKQIWDTGTCATVVHTDKGKFSTTQRSLYPPRADVTRQHEDSEAVDQFKDMNPFDAVTRATPKGGEAVTVNWAVPPELQGAGDYVLWVEASKAFDFNDTYNASAYPPPDVSYKACGEPYRGQPSVVYKVPFRLGDTRDVQMTSSYVGYGDIDGATGTLHPPDATITTDTPGSGALRLQLVSDSGNMYRVRATATLEPDYGPPDAPQQLAVESVSASTANLQFIETGDDGTQGTVSRYEIRVRAYDDITEDNFADSTLVTANVTPAGAGSLANLEIKGLLPETEYSVGIRAYDDCPNAGALTTLRFRTGDRAVGSVDACFIATAAYGSIMANEVETLRHFRDSALSKTILGELAIETYYTFGPAVASVVGESEMLRATARAILRPIIERVRALHL
jgi:hypothetical protein